MAITILGNHSRGYMGKGVRGIGTQNIPVGMGWDACAASEAGDIWVIQIGNIVIGDINQGVFFQSETGATVEFTLGNPGAAADPDPLINQTVLWGNSTPIPAGGQIVEAPCLFTCARVTFTAPGIVYLGVR